MAGSMNAAFGRIGATVRGFSLAQKTITIIGVAVLALGITLLVSWASKPAYTPLFSGLSAADANTIVEQLKTDGVPYEIASGGGTVLVPEADVYDQRLKAASRPSGVVHRRLLAPGRYGRHLLRIPAVRHV